MYKIFILKRQSKTEPLWTVYKIKDDYTNELIDYETENEENLSKTLYELLSIYPRDSLLLVKNASYIIDILINDD